MSAEEMVAWLEQSSRKTARVAVYSSEEAAPKGTWKGFAFAVTSDAILLVDKGEEYRYLVRSLAQISPSATACGLIGEAGFERCAARPLTGGTVTLFTAANGGEGAVEGSR